MCVAAFRAWTRSPTLCLLGMDGFMSSDARAVATKLGCTTVSTNPLTPFGRLPTPTQSVGCIPIGIDILVDVWGSHADIARWEGPAGSMLLRSLASGFAPTGWFRSG